MRKYLIIATLIALSSNVYGQYNSPNLEVLSAPCAKVTEYDNLLNSVDVAIDQINMKLQYAAESEEYSEEYLNQLIEELDRLIELKDGYLVIYSNYVNLCETNYVD